MADWRLNDFPGYNDEQRLRNALSRLYGDHGYGGEQNTLDLREHSRILLNDGEPLNLVADADIVARLTILGDGQRGTTIYQHTDHGCMDVGTTAGNLRDFQLIDIRFQGGTYGLDLQKAFYCDFIRPTFQGQTKHAVRVHNTAMFSPPHTLTNPWFTHQKGDVIQADGGWLRVNNGCVGEDVGRIIADGGGVWLDGASVFSWPSRNREGVLIARNGGKVYADACKMTAYNDEPILLMENAGRCRISGGSVETGGVTEPIQGTGDVLLSCDIDWIENGRSYDYQPKRDTRS